MVILKVICKPEIVEKFRFDLDEQKKKILELDKKWNKSKIQWLLKKTKAPTQLFVSLDYKQKGNIFTINMPIGGEELLGRGASFQRVKSEIKKSYGDSVIILKAERF